MSMRMTRKLAQLGAAAERSVRRAEESREATMTGLRPHTSERDPATSIATAKKPVLRERDKLLVAALTWNSSEKAGSRGCTQ
jgi:hypothetical protein